MTTFILTHKERERSPIAILISFRGKKYKKSIGESIIVTQWSDKKKRAKVTASTIDNSLINDSIELWEQAAKKTIAHFKEKTYIPSSQEFLETLQGFRFQDSRTERVFLTDYFNTFIERYTPIRAYNRIKQCKLTKGVFERYEKHIGKRLFFEDIDMNFYGSFSTWFYSQGYSTNYFGSTIRILKTVMTEARDIDKLHNNISINNSKFVAPSADSDNIYLTEEELLKIHHLDITPELIEEIYPDLAKNKIQPRIRAYSKARDAFLIGAFTGLRVSDYARLKEMNITDSIRIQTAKTGTKVVIPIHWVVQEILDKGFDFESKIYDQKINAYIKEVGKAAGICDEVMITKNIGGRSVAKTFKKYELITTHTARRSFATNAYKAGVPTIAIMKITGHTRETTFLRYIKVSEDENAEMLKNHDFFKKK